MLALLLLWASFGKYAVCDIALMLLMGMLLMGH
jgi:hypothetical protein